MLVEITDTIFLTTCQGKIFLTIENNRRGWPGGSSPILLDWNATTWQCDTNFLESQNRGTWFAAWQFAAFDTTFDLITVIRFLTILSQSRGTWFADVPNRGTWFGYNFRDVGDVDSEAEWSGLWLGICGSAYADLLWNSGIQFTTGQFLQGKVIQFV